MNRSSALFSTPSYVRQAAQPGDSLVATSQQTIYIYVRYRVDVTGFLSTKSLSMESTNSVMSSGNYGLQDQQLALKWLQQNARSFGGDPNRVTIFGHSAGSWSMCYHLTMPGSAGLFHSMIGEAGGCDQSFVTLSLEDNEAQGEKFAAALNCSAKQMNYNYTAQNQCMRSYSAVDINRAVDQVGSNLWYYSGVFYPVVDGLTVVDWPQNNFSSNPPLINSVPYLSSGALDETNYIPAGGDGDWVAATIPNNATTGETWATVGGWVSNVTSKHGADYSASKDLWNYYTNPDTVFDVRAYPSGTSTGSVAALVSLTSGIYFQCTQNRQAAAVTRSGSPAYLSKFGYVPQGQLQQAFHGSEVNYWLTVAQPLLYAGNINSTLARSMQQYWLSFIQNGNPNNSTNVQLKWGAPSALPAWPQYTTDGSKPNLQIGNHNTYDNATIFATTGYYDTKCAMLDRVIPYPVFTPRCNIGYTLSADGRVCVTPSASAATPGLPASSVMLSTGATVQQGASSTGTGAESRATGRALFRGLHRAVST